MKNTALITGASSGIGMELARIHAKNGGDLVIVARDQKKLDALKKELEKKYGVNVLVIVKDLSQQKATQEVYYEVVKSKIEINCLINNAGFGGMGKFHERDWSQDEAMIQLNIVALSSLTRYFLPDFIKRKNGKIMNVSSTAALFPGPLQAVYYATKAYVQSFSLAISEEVRGSGVTVTAVMPGATETDFGKRSGMDKTVLFKKTHSAKKVAQDAYNGMMKGKLTVLTGLSPGQRIMLKLSPFFSMRMKLKTIKKLQDTT